MSSASDPKPDTLMLHSGSIRTPFGETSEALFLNSAYCYETAEAAEARFTGENPGFTYSRYSNPNLKMVQDRLAALEGAEACLVTSSGMSAVFLSLMTQLRSGDHVIAHRVMFSSCNYIITELLPRYGIEVTLVDGTDSNNFAAAIQENTRCVFVESPSNPILEIIDIAAVASLCKPKDIRLIVDNVFASPLLQKPLVLGADIVVYSTTKHMDGQGRAIGGAVLCSSQLMENTIAQYHRHTGPHMSPHTAWLLMKSLETFSLRMERHCVNAAAIAFLLQTHPKVAWVKYPHLESHPHYALAKKQMAAGGGLLAFEFKDGKAASFRFMNALRYFLITNNLGDAHSLITHPASSTHASVPKAQRDAIGLTDGLTRISAGIEATEDLLTDVEQALKHA